MDDLRTIFVEGHFGTSALQISYWKDAGDVFLEYYIPGFYSYQDSGWDRIIRPIKIIWNLLRGKEFLLHEISFETKSEIRKFKEFVAAIDESRANDE